MTIDAEKVFDLVKLLSLIPTSEKLSFRTDFINWIKTLIKNWESFVLNRERSKIETKHYKPITQDSNTTMKKF